MINFYQIFCNSRLLSSFVLYVKIIIFELIITTFSLCYGAKAIPSIIQINKGEITKIELLKLNGYSIGNGEIIGVKIVKKKNIVLIKGKKEGFSSLLLMTRSGRQEFIKVYVTELNNLYPSYHALKNLGLITKFYGNRIIAKGTISNLSDYKLLSIILKKNQGQIFFNGKIGNELKTEIIAEIYKSFFEERLDNISCNSKDGRILCQYLSHYTPNKSMLDFYKKNYRVKFITKDLNNQNKNYLLKLKIFQFENLNGSDFSFGLSNLTANLIDVFNKNYRALISNNIIQLNSKKIISSILTEPEIILMLKEKTQIQIGSEISYSNKNPTLLNGTNIVWKFAGLKIDLTLKRKLDLFSLNYRTEFTRPSLNSLSISGNKQKSSLILSLNSPVQLFSIGFKTYSNNSDGLLFLSNIPILGEVFKSKSKRSTFKKLIGVINLQEI